MKFVEWILAVVGHWVSASVEEREHRPLCVPVTW